MLLLAVGHLCAQHPVVVERPAMGTPWSITVFAADTALARRTIAAAYARIEEIEQSMSDYRSDSEINRLNRLPVRRWHPASEDLKQVMHFSLELARWSDGAFDPTVGPLSRLWRRAFRRQSFPEAGRIGAAKALVNHRKVKVDADRGIKFRSDSVQLDLGGIAKGYALDAAGEVLEAGGISCYLIDGGGDLLLGRPPPGRTGWRVATPSGSLDTSRVAIATSGSSYRFLERNGVRYSHLIDPRTGLGIIDPRSVTVLAPTGMAADALASAASVLGEAEWLRRRQKFPRAEVIWSSLEGRR